MGSLKMLQMSRKKKKISLTVELSLPYLDVFTIVWILHNVFPEIFSKTWDIFTQESVAYNKSCKRQQ